MSKKCKILEVHADQKNVFKMIFKGLGKMKPLVQDFKSYKSNYYIHVCTLKLYCTQFGGAGVTVLSP